MKQLFSILLSALILLLATQDIGTYIAFKINQTFIANTWCININKPEVNCCGKCFLKNELKENHESEEDKSKIPSIEETIKSYYYTAVNEIQANDKPNISSNNFGYSILESQLYTFNFLDPPEFFLC